jgi:hypothetical protein
VVADLNFGTILQGGANQFDPGAFKGLTMAGLEWNVYSGLLSLQTTFIPPTSIQLDESSTLVTSGKLGDPDRRLKVGYGFGFGISALDGVVSAGWGRLYYDTRNIVGAASSDKHSGWGYLSLQPISLARLLIKRANPSVDRR